MTITFNHQAYTLRSEAELIQFCAWIAQQKAAA
jgi:hypothetical protein